VISGAEGSVAADEKTVSAVRAQMAALAEKNGYPKSVALAMVDLDMELVEVSIAGQIELVDAADLEIIQEEAEAQGKSFKKGRIVSQEGKLLTLTALEMEKYGISSGTPETRPELFSMLGLDSPSVLETETSAPDDIVALITGSSVTTILIMLGLGALYLEITSPGFGIPGTAAIIIFTVLFASNSMLGFVGSLEILLFLAGVVLLILELFLIPGFGAAGIGGFVLITISLLLSRQGFVIPEFSWQFDILRRNFINIGAGILGSIVLIALLFSFFPRTGIFGRLVLQSSQLKDDGFGMQTDGSSDTLVGKSGRAVTTLRPSGKADIDGNILVVETDGEFLDAGAEIIVTRVNSNRILVRGA
jgi:membrane-bound serine protease (ClpP class)